MGIEAAIMVAGMMAATQITNNANRGIAAKNRAAQEDMQRESLLSASRIADEQRAADIALLEKEQAFQVQADEKSRRLAELADARDAEKLRSLEVFGKSAQRRSEQAQLQTKRIAPREKPTLASAKELSSLVLSEKKNV